jgi:hypothetical protein
MKVKIEQISFESHNTYMDVESHVGYVDITIGGIENEKFSVTLEEWEIINEHMLKMFNQK